MKKQNQKVSNPYQYFSTPYEEKQLPTSVLFSGQAYQRPVKVAKVKQIVREFDPKLLDEIVVSFRDGKFYVVDGQHRIVALKQMNGGLDVLVNCKVISGLTYEQEADLYDRLDACKTKLSISDKTRAVAEAGSDQGIQDIKKILAANGIKWIFHGLGGHGGTNQITATRAILNAYSVLGFHNFAKMIRLVKRTWNGETQSLNMYIISGMALFVQTYDDKIKDDYFVKKLSKVSPQEIITAGKADTSTREMGLKYARVIWGKYNYKAAKNALPYEFKG